MELTLSPRLRRVLVWAGYPLFALLVAALALYASIPRDRIKDRLESGLSSEVLNADVTIGDLGLTLFTGLGLSLSDVVVRTRPVDASQKPARLLLDELRLKAGVFGLLFNRPTYRFRMRAFGGEMTGAIGLSPSQQRIEIDAKSLMLAGVPAASLPLAGTLSLKIDAVAPGNLLANLDGKLDIVVEDFILGDGKAKLTVPADPFLAQGVTFPRLRFGTVDGHVTIDKGKARLTGFHVTSPDGEAWLDGYVELRDPIGMSQMHGYLRFKPSDALVKREPTVELMTNAMGSTGKRPDGFIGFQLSGPLSAVYYLPSPNPPVGVTIPGGSPTVPSAPPVPSSANSMVPAPPPAAAPAPSADTPPPRPAWEPGIPPASELLPGDKPPPMPGTLPPPPPPPPPAMAQPPPPPPPPPEGATP